MAFGPVVLAECQKRVAKILVADPDDGSYAVATTDQMRYAPQEITDAILETDIEVCRTIVGALGNGYRQHYLSTSGALTNGAQLDFHPGKAGQVLVNRGGNNIPGIPAVSLEAITRYIEDAALFPNAAGRYYITEENVIWFVGTSAQVQTPSDLIITASCQAPQVYTATVIRGAVSILTKDGLDQNLFQDMYAQYQRDLEMIRTGENAVPALDLFKRAVG